MSNPRPAMGLVAFTFVLALAFYPNQASGLQCFECMDMKVIGKSPGSQSIGAQINPSCEAGSITAISSLTSRECSHGKVCVAAAGTARARDRHGKSVSYSVVTRSCGKTDSLGCGRGSDRAMQMFPSGGDLVEMRFKGDVCYCNKDYCSPVACPGGFAKIAGYCMEWWMVGALVVILIVTVALVSCCFCCCCCCFAPCKTSTKTAGKVVEREPAAFENQLYVVMATPPNHCSPTMDEKPSKLSYA